MANISIGKYDCLADPSYRSAQGNLGIEDAFSIDWQKYFDKVKTHPSGLFLMVRVDELGFLVFNNGNFTVTKAKNDDEIDSFIVKVREIVLAETGIELSLND